LVDENIGGIMKKCLLALSILLSGCMPQQQIQYSQSPSPAMKALLEGKPEPIIPSFKLSAKTRGGIEADLRNGLKDPESARFGMMNSVKHPDGTVSICGWVNAKNSYGGYTGEMPFIAVYSIKTGHAVMGPIESYDLIQPLCLKDGVSLEANLNSSLPINK
jgi:hypothetical protein